MRDVNESVPDELAAAAQAAVRWLNEERGGAFHVTGVVDADEAISQRAGCAPGGAFDLQLVLCQGELCIRERFRVSEGERGLQVALADDAEASGPLPELDPPPGARTHWLAEQLARHAYVVLVFYRGFW